MVQQTLSSGPSLSKVAPTVPSMAVTSRLSDSHLSTHQPKGAWQSPRALSSTSTGLTTTITPTSTSTVTTTNSSFNRTKSAQELHRQEKPGLDFFSQRKVQLPARSSNSGSNLRQLPPEIANFMNRVRNFSADGSESQTFNTLSQQSDSSPNLKRSGDSLLYNVEEASEGAEGGGSRQEKQKGKKRVEFSESVNMSKSLPFLDKENKEDETGVTESRRSNTPDERVKDISSSMRKTSLSDFNTASYSRTEARPDTVEFQTSQQTPPQQGVDEVDLPQVQQSGGADQQQLQSPAREMGVGLSSRSISMRQDQGDRRMVSSR